MSRRRLPPLTALKSFEAAARLGSFRDAADELCVSHSAVSHQIKLLESYLNLSLFDRQPRSVTLTKAGEVYFPLIRESFETIAEASSLIMEPDTADLLTVQVYSTFAVRWLIPRLAKFNEKYPKIEIRLNTSQDDVDFERSDVDLAVMIGSQTSEKLHYDYLFTSELFPVASPSLLEREGEITLEDLHTLQILQVYPSEKDWFAWLQAVGISTVHPQSGLQLDSYDHALSTASQGIGVALGMDPYIQGALREGSLVELFPGHRIKAEGSWYLVCRKDKAQQDNLHSFRQWLLEELALDELISEVEPAVEMSV